MASTAKAIVSAKRRLLEFTAVAHQVKKNKPRFIRRLQGLVRNDGGCIRALGHHTPDGYAKMNLRYKGKHIQIGMHRVFLILMLGRQIRLRHDAGHLDFCPHRDCVKHIEEQHQDVNCATSHRRAE